jgi:hypothetical protein
LKKIERIIALDIDGVLISNMFLNFLKGGENSLWLGKRQWLKRTLLRIFEIVEFLLLRLFKKRHQPNSELISFLNNMKAHKNDLEENLRFFIITDRSAFGLKNVWPEISELNLDKGDFIQVRGRKKLDAQKEKLANFLKTEAEILFSSSVKPHKRTILSLVLVASRLKPKEVWLVENDKNFLRVGKGMFLNVCHLKTFPSNEDKDIFAYLFQRAIR